MTMPEIILWSRLKGNQSGYRFRRQFGIGNFIVDFYCPQFRLIIEIDGISHDSLKQRRLDPIREKYFKVQGFNILRFTNKQIIENVDSAVQLIIERCKIFDK